MVEIEKWGRMKIGEDVTYAVQAFSNANGGSSSSSSSSSSSATPENLRALANAAISVIVEEKSEESCLSAPPLDGMEDIMMIKRTYSALVCIFLEAARTDLSSHQFLSFLTTQCALSHSTANPLCDLLLHYKHQLRRALSRTANNGYLQRLTGVEWTLENCVSASEDKSFKELVYFVGFKTAGSEATLQFACTVEQLQDLHAQLKDACKAVQRGF